MKASAVQCLVNYMEENFHLTDEAFLKFKEAKEMEKQQIAEAYRTGVEEDVYNNPLRTGMDYYNEKFNK